jgi:fibronectin type 3 domain-containing protein
MRKLRGILILALLALFVPSMLFAIGIQVSWLANSDEGSAGGTAGYKVYFGTAPGVYGTPIDVGTVKTYNLNNLKNATTYYIAVSAYDASGNESAKSTEISGTTPIFPIAPAITATGGTKSIALSWSAINGAVAYKIYYGTATGSYGAPVSTVDTTYTLTGLQDGTVYYIAISTVDAYTEESAKSMEVSCATKDTTPPAAPGKPTLKIIP